MKTKLLLLLAALALSAGAQVQSTSTCDLASATQPGCLSPTDWSLFNSKLAALPPGVMLASQYHFESVGAPVGACPKAGANDSDTSTTPADFYFCPNDGGPWIGPFLTNDPTTSGALWLRGVASGTGGGFASNDLGGANVLYLNPVWDGTEDHTGKTLANGGAAPCPKLKTSMPTACEQLVWKATPQVVCTGAPSTLGGDTLTSEQSFSVDCAVPAGLLGAGKTLSLDFGLQVSSPTTAPGKLTLSVLWGNTRIYQISGLTPVGLVNRGAAGHLVLQGSGATLETSGMFAINGWGQPPNLIAQPVAGVDVSSVGHLKLSAQYSTAAPGQSISVRMVSPRVD